MADDMDAEGREVETLIEDWNASRVDIFAISKPDDNLEFSGVMRFYFQEPGAKDRKVATKCIRVNSSHTTEEVMKILVEKFHPDLKMLTSPNYSLYEVHETGTEARKLDLDEKPLYVQLYWQESDRDGRFLLKSEEEQMTTQSLFDPNEQNFKRRLSKREKKEMKKKRRIQAKQSAAEKTDGNEIAKQLYGDRPTSGLTRSLSNPEAVMRKRREMRLLKKMEQYEDTETNPGGGGPLRIFAESLQPEIPYKTLLFSNHHTTDHVLRTALEKYEVPAEEMDMYCLTMVTIFPGNQSDIESAEIKERVVHDDDCPLAIASSWPENKGEIRFYIKKKENMPKSKRAVPKRVNPQMSPSPVREASPPPIIETTFDITDVPSNEKEPVSSPPVQSPPVQSPPVHVVDSSHALPATLEFHESGEDAFFAVVVSEVNGSAVHFKLAPTYTLYMCCRYRLSPKFRPDFSPNKRRENVAMTAKKVANMMWQTVKENTSMAGHLAFWMANASEFLHFLKQDEDLSAMTEESQKILAHTTQQAFRSIVQCIKTELQGCLPAFLDPSDESDYEEGENDLEGEQFDPNEGYLSTERSFRVKNFSPNGRPIGGDQWMGKRKKASRPVVGDVLHTLSSAMSLLRRCRVNAALTLQLFSQLFHYINMFLFNRLVLEPQLQLCTRAWGVRLMQRLGRIQDWAENLGVEMAAECHLGRATQAAFLLQVPKQDTAVISSHCYKLNSLQLRQLLELYEPERDEPEIPVSLIDNVVAVAENTADSLARDEGQEVRLEEEPDLHLPFLLPEDGYSSEQIRGVPPGLREFLEPLIKPGLCRLTIQTKASGLWTVHFKSLEDPEIPPPETSPAKELTKISINKGGKGMGVSIVAAKGVGQERSGIYVKEIVEGGPAYLDGRLKPGDQILEVNGESLIGITQEDAVKVLIKAGQVVNMTISKAAVWQHGLTLLLKQPATVNKVEPVSRNVEPPSNLALKKENPPPRAPPRYRTQHDGAPRSPVNTRNVTEGSEPSSPKQGRQPDPRQRRRSPYDSEYKDWKNQVQHDGPPEQASVSTKATVEYKQDEVSLGQKLYKAPVPYANPQDIQRRQKEMQDRKLAEERREQENMERERIKRDDEERQERERQERERQERERQERERQERERQEREHQEHERIKREEIARREQREREQKEREQREREQREQKERERIQREELEQQERRERERIDRERIDREELERKKRDERERIQREELERKEREKREEQEKKEREERERRKFQERELDEMSRHERELEMKLDQKRRDKEKRLQELRRQLEEEEAEAEGMEREYRERMSKKRDERVDPQRSPVPKDVRLPAAANTQVHYVSDQAKGREIEESKRETARAEERMPARRVDYGKRQQLQNQESLDIDPTEVERQFQQRLAQEERKDEPDGQNFVTVIRVPVQQDNWESPEGGDYGSGDRAENTRKRLERVDIDPNSERPEADVADKPRARVDWQRNEDERYRKEAQLKREQDEQLVREFQKSRTVEGESYRQQPVGAGVEPNYPPRQADWEKDDELRRQREEDDRLREARANQLRNRCIEKPEDDESNRSYVNGRTKRVKFATVRTEITQPSPDIELAKAGVKFVHDGKVADSEDEDEFRRPPPPEDEPPPLRPPPPPKPQYLVNNKVNGSPAEYPSYRGNEPFINAQPQARMTEQEMRYATYPGRQQHNNNYPVPKPRVPRNVDSKSPPSPDQARLPFKDKMKVFNENTPPKKQTTSRWERDQNTNINGDTL